MRILKVWELFSVPKSNIYNANCIQISMRLWGACLFVVAILMLLPLQPAVSASHNDFTAERIKKYIGQIDNKGTVSLDTILKELMKLRNSLQDDNPKVIFIYAVIFTAGFLEGWLVVEIEDKCSGFIERHPLLSNILAFVAGFAEGFLVLGPIFAYLEEHYEGFDFGIALLVFEIGCLIGGYLNQLLESNQHS